MVVRVFGRAKIRCVSRCVAVSLAAPEQKDNYAWSCCENNLASNREQYRKIQSLVRQHEDWFSESLPLIASENVASKATREVLSSDLGHRYAEGWPGERVYAGCKYIDEIELKAMNLAKQLFRAEFVDVRPTSGVCANLSVYSAVTEPGNIMMALSIPNGGHISMGKKDFSGTAGLVHGLQVEYLAFDKEEMNINIEATKERVNSLHNDGKDVKLAMFGGSLFLFPHPLRELADFLKSLGIVVCYDAAHVAGLIAGDQFQDPLREGAEIMTFSTHKTLFGPQGGTIVANEKYGENIKKAVFPGTSSNHHLQNVAAKAMVFAEFLEYGRAYAKQVIQNAKTLAERLDQLGENVLGSNKGYTQSHQIAVDITKYGDGGMVEKKLESMNVIVNRQLLPGDLQAGRHYTNPGGIRLGVAELTRLGMKKDEMKEVAEILHLALSSDKRAVVTNRVRELRKQFQQVHYSFQRSPAYFYH
jgi:glycine hydroxymethyltransferase